MFSLPSPLHPAVVHFPIVLLLLGSVVACAAVVLRRWQLPQIAAVLLALGAAGSVVAVQTGEEDGEAVEGRSAAVEQILDEHEDWAERTRNAGVIAGVLAVASACLVRMPKAARGLGAAAAIAAVASAYCVAETGHYGGQLVYRHGAGVNTTGAAVPAGEREHDKD
jgi:uncharacterized membrane protein